MAVDPQPSLPIDAGPAVALTDDGTAPDERIVCVVLNWRDTERTVRCILNLMAERLVSRIHVIDNESDGSLRLAMEELHDDRIDLVENPLNLGFSSGVNVGLRRAATEASAGAVLVINNDAYLIEHALTRMLRGLRRHPARAMVGPAFRDPHGNRLASGGVLKPWTMSAAERADATALDFLTWACVLIDSQALLQIGLLDERFFMYWEDVEFGLRVRESGYEFAVEETAVVVHEISSSHAEAGAKIALFSTMGAVVLARRVGGPALVGVWYRVLGRLVKYIFAMDLARARAVFTGTRLGLQTTDGENAALTLSKRRIL